MNYKHSEIFKEMFINARLGIFVEAKASFTGGQFVRRSIVLIETSALIYIFGWLGKPTFIFQLKFHTFYLYYFLKAAKIERFFKDVA